MVKNALATALKSLTETLSGDVASAHATLDAFGAAHPRLVGDLAPVRDMLARIEAQAVGIRDTAAVFMDGSAVVPTVQAPVVEPAATGMTNDPAKAASKAKA